MTITDSNRPMQRNWHALPVEEALRHLETSINGLPLDEARRRLAQYGPNRLPAAQRPSALSRLLRQFHNVLIYVLITASLVTAWLGHWIDTGVIFGVVLINALIGFVQEGKAENSLQAIRAMLSLSARVFRDGHLTTLAAEALVPGDVVLLQSGDRVPADLRLLDVKELQIQESALTGESLPVEKQTEPVATDSALADQSCMAWSGTLVSHGQGKGVVVATGAATRIGGISRMVSEVQTLTTPLLKQMDQFGRWLTAAILALAALTFTFGIGFRGYGAADMFLASVSLAVAAIPEGLPAIMSITLAIGVQRMARRNAIIRRLPAVETLGAVSVICTDKTGTLTRNEMMLHRIATCSNDYALTGTGYVPHGTLLCDGTECMPDQAPDLQEILRAGVLCNDASLEQGGEEWSVHGDPTEGALLVAAVKVGMDTDIERKRYPRTDLIPFESEHRFMATLHHSHDGQAFILVKGAPERLLEMCSHQRCGDGEQPLDRSFWEAQVAELADQGQRVLAIASRSVSADKQDLYFDDVQDGLILLGLLGLIDPPRAEAIAAVRDCQQAGIRVKMITGDHAATARAIARQVGLINTRDVLTGPDLGKLSDDRLRGCVEQVDIYARVSPGHKLKLVEQLQQRGHIVAMTGDGVNDAPALKRADVGVAMGCSGTEAAKEAAEVVLADDNFASIAAAVREGRTVHDNLKKAILFILPTNGGEALIILGAILFGFEQLPLTPLQILWVNMITAVTLALALAFEPPEPNVMSRPPRDPAQPMLTTHLLWRIAFVSVILMGGTFALFLWAREWGADIQTARTAAVNTLVLFEIFYLFSARYVTEPVLNRHGLTGNPQVLTAISALLLLQLAFTYLPIVQHLFGTADLAAGTWLHIVLVAPSVLFLVELEKAWIRRLQGRHRPTTAS